MGANGVPSERVLVLFRRSNSSFVDFRFKTQAVERQRIVGGCDVVVIKTSESTAPREPPPM